MITSGSASTTAYWIENDEYRSIASGFSYALLSIIGNRLLFNLKEVGERDVIINSGGGQHTTLSDIQFASTPTVDHGGNVESNMHAL